MINEDKVRLMTKLEIYEMTKGRKQFNIIKYYKRDYVRYHMFRTAVTTTLAYLIIAAVYIYMNYETILASLTEMDLLEEAKKFGLMYVIFLVFYLLVAWVVYAYKYNKVKPDIINYSRNLKRLQKIYEKEEKELYEIQTGKGVRSTDEDVDNY